jgi:peptidoglycan pentaglycine glycine transferase (the first glycine)
MTGQSLPGNRIEWVRNWGTSGTGWDCPAWNDLIAGLPGAHILQTGEWAQLKARVGWQALPQVWWDAGGQVVAAAMLLKHPIPVRGLSARLSVFYVPKGPLLNWEDPALRARVLADLVSLVRQEGGIFIKIDPDVWLGQGIPGQPDERTDPVGQAVMRGMIKSDWHLSDEQIQFRNTVLIDLTPDLDTLLANMKQKARYNLRLAERKGVTVRPATETDLPGLYHMYAETSTRDGFVIRDQEYYLGLWSVMMRAGMAEPLLAEVEAEPVAAVVVFRFAGRAWYIHGMSRQAHREKMPNHLLQWEAMRRAKAAGCTAYDLWGAPDVFDESDSMWGVYRFKEGLGGQVYRGLGAWDLPVRPMFYRLYTQILPRILDVMRNRGNARTKQLVTRSDT